MDSLFFITNIIFSVYTIYNIMEDNQFLELGAFGNRLNVEGFVKAQDDETFTPAELKEKYPEDTHTFLSKAQVNQFISDVNENLGGEIKKGGMNDTDIAKDLQNVAEKQIQGLEMVEVTFEKGAEIVYILKNQKETFQKGKISEAFTWGENKLEFKKKGSDFKVLLEGAVAKIDAKIIAINATIEACKEKLNDVPTKVYDGCCESEGIEIPHLMFHWNQTYYNEDSNQVSGTNVEGQASATSVADAELNSSWNNNLSKLANLLGEKSLVEVYRDNLDDKKEYTLSGKQLLALKL